MGPPVRSIERSKVPVVSRGVRLRIIQGSPLPLGLGKIPSSTPISVEISGEYKYEKICGKYGNMLEICINEHCSAKHRTKRGASHQERCRTWDSSGLHSPSLLLYIGPET